MPLFLWYDTNGKDLINSEEGLMTYGSGGMIRGERFIFFGILTGAVVMLVAMVAFLAVAIINPYPTRNADCSVAGFASDDTLLLDCQGISRLVPISSRELMKWYLEGGRKGIVCDFHTFFPKVGFPYCRFKD